METMINRMFKITIQDVSDKEIETHWYGTEEMIKDMLCSDIFTKPMDDKTGESTIIKNEILSRLKINN